MENCRGMERDHYFVVRCQPQGHIPEIRIPQAERAVLFRWRHIFSALRAATIMEIGQLKMAQWFSLAGTTLDIHCGINSALPDIYIPFIEKAQEPRIHEIEQCLRLYLTKTIVCLPLALFTVPERHLADYLLS